MFIFRMGLRQKFVLLLLATVAVLLFTQWAVSRANEEIARASRQRYVSYLLADELRQSSDDLTRLVRTYVVTGDPRWEQQYNEVVNIRSGKQPRPAGYEGSLAVGGGSRAGRGRGAFPGTWGRRTGVGGGGGGLRAQLWRCWT